MNTLTTSFVNFTGLPQWRRGDLNNLALFATLGAVLALIGYLFWSGYETNLRAALITTDNLAMILADDIESSFDRAQSDLRGLALQVTGEDLSGHVPEARRRDIEARIAAHLLAFPAMVNYHVFDANGQVVFGAGKANRTQAFNVSDRAWFQQLRDDPRRDFVMSDLLVAKSAQSQAIILGIAIRDGDGRFVGVVNAVVNLTYFQTLVDRLDIGTKGMVAVRRKDDGRLILRRPPMGAEDNVKRVSSRRMLTSYPLTVTVALAADDFLAPWRAQTALLGVTALVLLVSLIRLYRREQSARARVGKIAEDLKQSEAHLSDEAARLDLILSSAGEGIYGIDANGHFLFINPSARRFLGIADDVDLIGQSAHAWNRHSGADARPCSNDTCHVIRTIRDGISRHSDNQFFRRQDGTLFPVELSANAMVRDGACSGAVVTFRDISDRKEVEARLRDSEERFRSLVEGTTDWVWETDKDHRFSWISQSLDPVLGIPSTTLLGRLRRDLVSPEHEIEASQWQAHLADLDARRAFRDYRYWIQASDGQARWISVSGAPRFDERGGFLGYRGCGTDITAQADTAQRLRMLSTAVERSPVSVVITDVNGTIEYVNSHFTAVTGYEAVEAIGGNSRMVSSGLTSIETYRDMWATITAGQRWVGELRNRRKSGELYWEMVVIAPVLDDGGKVSHYVSIKEDVTERRDLQDKLKQTNSDLEQFAYVASHDLRQPLRMISSYLSIAQDRLGPQLDDDTRKYFGYAVGGAKRMDRLILDLLDYSRTGKRAESGPVMLAEVVADALANLTVAISEAEAEVVVAEDLPTVKGDEMDLIRLFQNLIGNAVKYRAPERRPRIEIGCRRSGPDLLVTVSDNGMGIAPSDRERAFGIFQRLVPKDQYEGNGIGLAVCKKIVEQHGGRIWIEPSQGEGTTFIFSLPAA
ncbi:MAG TPA: PAS domain S-box protein [Rhodospirillaceae bacterium]|nr:PAS domain S-box protein [Rhodospirillaceae bacterium]